MLDAYHWWQKGIIYECYVRSFMDSNGNGVGDLPGLISKLDYLQWLGIDAIWLTPIFPSPMADFGYDVANYTDIDPLFGTLADFDTLVAEAHRRNLKIILDYIPNHTSDQHPWFRASRSARDNPARDWYIWRDPAPDGGPPTNWLSVFGGKAWSFDQETGQYYYHAYLRQQPDLNWRNSEVQAMMLDVLRFWLDRGVDGFRIDALRQLIKDAQWRDNPPNPDFRPEQGEYHKLRPVYTTDQPEIHTMIARMRQVADAYDDSLLIGELYLPIKQLVTYYGGRGSGLQLPFNFHLIFQPWNAEAIAGLIKEYEAALPPDGWPNWVLGNHDKHRLASRIGTSQTRVAAMLLLTLRGTPTLYYGDEIGMRNVSIPPARVQDPRQKNEPDQHLGRDPERTPMQWDSRPHAGFTSGKPWLPIADDAATVNVAAERADPTSLLTLYQRLIALRRNTPALAVGDYQNIATEANVLSYTRAHGDQQVMIALNFDAQAHTLDVGAVHGRVILSTYLDRRDEDVGATLELRADEGIIVML